MRRFVLVGLILLVFAVDNALAASKSYYDILQVSKHASEDQIKRSYRKLALKLHPDKNPGNEDATKQFAEITNAYEVLTDSEKRRIYDQHGEAGLKQTGSNRGGGFGGDIFQNLFGNSGFRFGFNDDEQNEEDAIPKGHDVSVDLFVTLEDLYMGTSIRVWREKNVLKPAPGKRQCKCKNKLAHKQIGPGMFQQYTQQVCEECPNVKFERDGMEITVEIEQGMKDGQEIVFYDDGEPIIDGDPGDLKFIVHTEEHDVFTRDGNNLYVTVTISLVESLVGFEKKVFLLDGHQVSIGTKEITKPKQKRRFPGEGMPVYESVRKGDLFVHFEVEFPSKLSKEQKDSIKETLGSLA